jgi:capsular polysaccharide biosynthesis protein
MDTYEASTCSNTFRVATGICLLAFSSGYYHWLLEGVPRVLDLIADGVDFDRYPLIMPPLTSFHREFLQLFGIDASRQVLTVSPGEWCRVDDCIIPTLPFPFAAAEVEDPSGQPSRTLLQRIQKRVLDRLYALEGRRVGLPARLYISLAKAAKRKFTAQTEVLVSGLLEQAGYTTVFLEELDWYTQIHLLAGAESVAGLHGAGLANILFSNARSLLEFQNPMETRAYFAVMARELGVSYRYVIGFLEGESGNFDNISLDLEQLQASLNLPAS